MGAALLLLVGTASDLSASPRQARTAARNPVEPSGSSTGGGSSSIPHILHQSWKTAQVPALPNASDVWRISQKSWRDRHRNWTYMLHTDEDNRRLVHDRYPWFLATYDALRYPVMRADAAR